MTLIWKSQCLFAEMNEMLFECYAFPHVAYGVDGMFAYYKAMENSN